MTDPMIIQIPSEIENVQLPTPELLTFYKDKEHRCLWIDDDLPMGLAELLSSVLIVQNGVSFAITIDRFNVGTRLRFRFACGH